MAVIPPDAPRAGHSLGITAKPDSSEVKPKPAHAGQTDRVESLGRTGFIPSWLKRTMGVGTALGTMGYMAWIFRHDPHLGVAKGLAFYQIASATADWVMWLVMKDQGIFDNGLAQTTVTAAIASHYFFGICLIVAIRRSRGA